MNKTMEKMMKKMKHEKMESPKKKAQERKRGKKS